MHACPMVTGLVPHVGGPVLLPACRTVLIGNLPAAPIGDMLTCLGPPDVDCYRITHHAERLVAWSSSWICYDSCRVITVGMATVLICVIAEPTFSLPSNIMLSGTSDFQTSRFAICTSCPPGRAAER